MTKIYLAGKMTGLNKKEMNGWREEVKQELLSSQSDKVVINPIDYYNFYSFNWEDDKEYIRWELNNVEKSDLVIVGWNKEQDSLGTMAELTYAYSKHVPVILYLYDTNKRDSYDVIENIHPYVWYISDKAFCRDEIKGLSNYVNKYYCF